MFNTVVVWLHILGPYWCMCVALFGSRLSLTQSTDIEMHGMNVGGGKGGNRCLGIPLNVT